MQPIRGPRREASLSTSRPWHVTLNQRDLAHPELSLPTVEESQRWGQTKAKARFAFPPDQRELAPVDGSSLVCLMPF